MYKKIIAGFTALIGMGAAAHAADLGGSLKDGPAPVASYAPIWAGLYVGGSVGFGAGDTSGKITDINFDRKDDYPTAKVLSEAQGERSEGGFDLGSLLSSDYDVNGAIYGVHVGYNFQRDNIVLGVEVGFNGADIDGSGDAFFGLIKSERELDWYATAVARLGYASGKALFYGFGGVAWGTVDTTLSIPLVGASFSGESDHVGWTAGVGIEYAMTERFSVRVEYSHVDLGEETARINLGHGLSIDDEVDLSFDAIKIGASYRFGGGDHGLEPLK
jgi:outer membrane immunogenic protein